MSLNFVWFIIWNVYLNERHKLILDSSQLFASWSIWSVLMFVANFDVCLKENGLRKDGWGGKLTNIANADGN